MINRRLFVGGFLLLFFFGLIAIGFPIATAQNGTNEKGIINSGTTWTKANSPYNLVGNVLVPQGVTLTIQAGATVNLGSYYIEVNGTLSAIGGSSNQIHITGGSIQFDSSSTGGDEQTESGCIIQNAIITNTPIVTVNTSPNINNNSISTPTNPGYAIFVNNGSPIISYNKITGNIGTETSLSTPISNNQITGNILLGGSGTITNNIVDGYISAGGPNGTTQIQNNHVSKGISVGPGSNTISNNTITGGNVGINLSIAVTDDVFSNNISNCETGIQGYALTPVTVKGNIITNNKNYGIQISYGQPLSFTGKTSTDTMWYISGNTITGSQTGIDGSAISINDNLILNNIYGINGAAQTIQNNTIKSNSIGINDHSAAIPSTDISYNNIEGNYNYSVYLPSGSTANVNATYNWWGTTDKTTISQSIYDFKNDFNVGTVTFQPILTAPNQNAPTTPTASPTTTTETPSSISRMPEITAAIVITIILAIILTAIIYRKTIKKQDN